MEIQILVNIVNYIWFTIPAYVANPGAVLFKGKFPMDFNKNFYDGRRLFGKGKTWKGFFGGAFTGIFIGFVQIVISYIIPNEYLIKFSQSFLDSVLIVILLSFGAMIGDCCGSFIKRRLNMESGSNAFLLDQYPFILFSIFLLYLAFPDEFFKYIWNVYSILTLIIYTPLIHRIVNIIGYKIGRKEVPW
ncbi:MAG: CDP-2,3-bis-(O-geranylgeranyl)-sn-glycerol synthase [Thermoplasmata archaeon]|nr:CDP-2,3-bis-(O-geranylgeranyl)-sn-glycerol synthase [Euryarchaeota archaeon]MVT35880.1 CDP-2,3-bis-(O-geranylgeranyl)-sn-glycerol synthase [Euryarchaeota archaeon]